MTEFKYGSSNYNKKSSTTDKANLTTVNTASLMEDTVRRPHPRLKKSYSECEYYENLPIEVNFNLSPSNRANKDAVGDLHQHRFKQTSINDIAFIDGNSAKLQYNYDTLKSQYLLQQQQKLKEYKNDPNYLPNGDNYSSESSTETRGILKNNGKSLTATTASESCNKNSLKRNKGLSTLSLCSCDAETEVTMKFFHLLLNSSPQACPRTLFL